MRKLMRFLAGVVVTLLPAVASAQTHLQETINVGTWSGGAYFEDRTNQFSHCAISSPYVSGNILLFMYSAAGFSVGLADHRWSLGLNDQYDVWLDIDGRWSRRVVGIVPADAIVRVDFGEDWSAVDRFRKGRLLTVHAQGGTLYFQLTGTSRAIAAVYSCYEAYRWGHSSNPFAGIPSNPFASNTATSRSGSAWRITPTWSLQDFEGVLRTVLGESVVALDAGSDSPADYLASDGAVLSVYWEEESRNRSADQVFAQIASGLHSECHGKAASAIAGRYDRGHIEVRKGFIACQDPNPANDYYLALVVVDYDAVAQAFVLMPLAESVTDANRAMVERASGKVENYMVQFVSGLSQ